GLADPLPRAGQRTETGTARHHAPQPDRRLVRGQTIGLRTPFGSRDLYLERAPARGNKRTLRPDRRPASRTGKHLRTTGPTERVRPHVGILNHRHTKP